MEYSKIYQSFNFDLETKDELKKLSLILSNKPKNLNKQNINFLFNNSENNENRNYTFTLSSINDLCLNFESSKIDFLNVIQDIKDDISKSNQDIKYNSNDGSININYSEDEKKNKNKKVMKTNLNSAKENNLHQEILNSKFDFLVDKFEKISISFFKIIEILDKSLKDKDALRMQMIRENKLRNNLPSNDNLKDEELSNYDHFHQNNLSLHSELKDVVIDRYIKKISKISELYENKNGKMISINSKCPNCLFINSDRIKKSINQGNDIEKYFVKKKLKITDSKPDYNQISSKYMSNNNNNILNANNYDHNKEINNYINNNQNKNVQKVHNLNLSMNKINDNNKKNYMKETNNVKVRSLSKNNNNNISVNDKSIISTINQSNQIGQSNQSNQFNQHNSAYKKLDNGIISNNHGNNNSNSSNITYNEDYYFAKMQELLDLHKAKQIQLKEIEKLEMISETKKNTNNSKHSFKPKKKSSNFNEIDTLQNNSISMISDKDKVKLTQMNNTYSNNPYKYNDDFFNLIVNASKKNENLNLEKEKDPNKDIIQNTKLDNTLNIKSNKEAKIDINNRNDYRKIIESHNRYDISKDRHKDNKSIKSPNSNLKIKREFNNKKSSNSKYINSIDSHQYQNQNHTQIQAENRKNSNFKIDNSFIINNNQNNKNNYNNNTERSKISNYMISKQNMDLDSNENFDNYRNTKVFNNNSYNNQNYTEFNYGNENEKKLNSLLEINFADDDLLFKRDDFDLYSFNNNNNFNRSLELPEYVNTSAILNGNISINNSLNCIIDKDTPKISTNKFLKKNKSHEKNLKPRVKLIKPFKQSINSKINKESRVVKKIN